MTSNIKSQQNNLQKANQLLANIKKENSGFIQKTDNFVKDINQDIEEAENEINEIDKDLRQFEKQTINKIDKAVLELVSEKGILEE